MLRRSESHILGDPGVDSREGAKISGAKAYETGERRAGRVPISPMKSSPCMTICPWVFEDRRTTGQILN